MEIEAMAGCWFNHEGDLHINCKELLGILFELKALCRDDRNTHIRVTTDNQTAMAYVRKMGGTHSPKANGIARQIWLWAVKRNNWLSVAHILGVQNVEADEKSRKFHDSGEWQLDTVAFNQ